MCKYMAIFLQAPTGPAKALKAKRIVSKGVHSEKKRKMRSSVSFRKPRTLKLPRNPKYPRKSVPKRNK